MCHLLPPSFAPTLFLAAYHSRSLSLSLSVSHSYQLATGSSENVVKVWDMRRRANIYTIPAHSALVAAVKYVEGRE
jgi:U4/U6 small nuclear ribonucleoprotein PRP4